jgi:hypothetical protein
MSKRELGSDTYLAIEVIKLNELQHEESSAELLTLSQLRTRANNKITIVEEMLIEEL